MFYICYGLSLDKKAYGSNVDGCWSCSFKTFTIWPYKRAKHSFSLRCRAVKFTSKLFGRALSKRIKATVLYATETGKSEQYAKQLCELLGHAFNAQVSLT